MKARMTAAVLMTAAALSCTKFGQSETITDLGFEVATEVAFNSDYLSNTLSLRLESGTEGAYVLNYMIDTLATVHLTTLKGSDVESGDKCDLSLKNPQLFLLPKLSGDSHTLYLEFEREGVSRLDTVTFKTETAVAVRMDCSEDLDFTRVILSNRMGASLTSYEVTFYLDGDLLTGMKYLGNEFGGSMELDFARSESYTFELPYIVSGDHTLRTEISSELGSEVSVVTFTEPERKPTQLTFSYNDVTGQLMLLSGHNPLQTEFDITLDITVKGQVTYRHKQFFGVADPETVKFTETGQAKCCFVPGLTAKTVDSGKLKELMDKIYSNTRTDASNAIGNGNARTLHADITSVDLLFTITSKGKTPGKTSVAISPSSYLPVKYLYKSATWLRAANTTQTINPTYKVNGKYPYLIHSL
ncbi:MAG: hypothetical protein ACI4UJ_05580 [Candidatus Cryptobacteroides sp.]